MTQLPRGIWFEDKRNRYRVRKYRNGHAYLVYCKTEADARRALEEIQQALMSDPKTRVGTGGGSRLKGMVPAATFRALIKASQKEKS